MDIEAIVKKHSGGVPIIPLAFVEGRLRAALTELAQWYEQRLTFMKDNSDRCQQEMIARFDGAQERIRQLDGALTRAGVELSEKADRIRQLEAERVPKGWQLVPVEPTPEMVDAVLRYANGDDLQFYGANELRKEISGDWAIMLATVTQQKKEGE